MTRGGGDLTSTDTHVTLNDPPCGLLWYENGVFMSYLSPLHHACCAAAHTDMTRPISFSRARNVTQDTLSVFTQNRVKRYSGSHDHKAVGFKSLNVPMQSWWSETVPTVHCSLHSLLGHIMSEIFQKEPLFISNAQNHCSEPSYGRKQRVWTGLTTMCFMLVDPWFDEYFTTHSEQLHSQYIVSGEEGQR